MKYYPIICVNCNGDGKVKINPKPTMAGTKYDLVKCPICNGLGSVLVSEDRLTKIS